MVESSTSNIPATLLHAGATVAKPFTTTLSERGEDIRATFVPLSNAGQRVATVVVWKDAGAIETLDCNLGIAFAVAIPLFGIATALSCSAITPKVLVPLEQISPTPPKLKSMSDAGM